MNETDTRRKKIDPRLTAVGWDVVPEALILTEQRAYEIAPGRINMVKRGNPKKVDYVLEYHGRKLAVIEAKSDERSVHEGVEQAKDYARRLQIRYAYATNGDEIWAIDMGLTNAQGEFVSDSHEGEAEKFPTPQELWQMTYGTQDPWRDRFNLCRFNRAGGRMPRYYQEIAVTNVLNAIARQQRRILLTMATGTGKTYTAFQICWKLMETHWNTRYRDDDPQTHRKPRILFISDRNILSNQAKIDFDNFHADEMERITPELLHKHRDRVPTSQQIYFTIFQTFMAKPRGSEQPYYMQYPPEFFDFVIIDECHRGGANDESEWRDLLEYFAPAYQLGMTATPRRRVNANTYNYFGDPVYSYSLKQGIADGFLTPFRVRRAESNGDTYSWSSEDRVRGDIDKEREYVQRDFDHGTIQIRDRDEHRVIELLNKIDPDEKTLVFCATQEHAATIRDLINKHKRRPESNYCMRVTADDGERGEKILREFQDNERMRPTILTTSHKLSTGVDARNVRNIVLMREVQNMVEFKQIMGRGTRLFDNKFFFTLYDFVGASQLFADEEWDGDPICPVCGNYPCSCRKGKKGGTGGNAGGTQGGGDVVPQPDPCPVCGHLPCTCDGGQKRTIEVKLSLRHRISLYTEWTETFDMGGEQLTPADFLRRFFGEIPSFFGDEESLTRQWEQPQTRQALLDLLASRGFTEDKLDQLKRVLEMEHCDLYDVLRYIAEYGKPLARSERAELLRRQYLLHLSPAMQQLDDKILHFYVNNGFRELQEDKLSFFLNQTFGSITDAKRMTGMSVPEMRRHFLDLQTELYNVITTSDGKIYYCNQANIASAQTVHIGTNIEQMSVE